MTIAKRFELEEKIMQAWQVTSDVELIYRKVTDECLSEDELSNALLGIMTIYNLRFNDLFDAFEQMLKEESLRNELQSNTLQKHMVIPRQYSI